MEGPVCDSFDSVNSDSEKTPLLGGEHLEGRSGSGYSEKRKSLSEDSCAKKSVWEKYRGHIYVQLTSVFVSFSTLIAKLLIDYHPFNVALWGYQGVFILSIPLLIYFSCFPTRSGESIYDSILPIFKPSKLKINLFLFLRSFLSCTSVILHFYALQYIDIGDATAIAFTTPVFVGILSQWFLGEKFGFVPIIAALLTVVGIIVIARPPILFNLNEVDSNNLIGVGLALGSMLLVSVTLVILRWIRAIDYALVTFFNGFYSVLECTICALALGVLKFPQNLTDLLLAITLGILAFAGQSFIVQALKYEEAGPVSVVRNTEVIFTFLWQIIFLSQIPDVFSIVGTFTILFAVVIITVRKWISELPPEHCFKIKLWFLLK